MAILARHQFDATDEAGNILTDVIVEVRRESDSGLAVLYDGRDTTTAGLVGNPFTVASGKVGFHVIGGAYRVILTKGAYTRTLRYVGIGRASESDLTSNNPQGAWDIGATYSVGDLVTHPVGVGQFISLQNGNIGHQPDNTTPGDTAYWMYIGKMAGVDGADGTGLFSRVRVVSTTNITIATALNNGDSLDGVTLATNDLVLVAGQTAPAENGVYVVGASPARDSSFDTYNEHPGVYLSVMEGTVNADTLWRCTSNKGGTLNTTAIVFSQLSTVPPDGSITTTKLGGDITAAGKALLDDANAAAQRTTLGLGDAALQTYSAGSTTPTPTSQFGSFTSVSATLSYTRIGDRVVFDCTVAITTAGTAAGFISVPLPFTPVNRFGASGSETAATWFGVTAWGNVGSAFLYIMKYDATTIIATGRSILLSGSFKV